MDVVIFLLDVPKHCIHIKTMGPLGAWSFVVFAPTIHNIVRNGNLSSHPRDMFCKNFEADNYLITNLTHSKRAYNNSNNMPTRNYYCSIILQRPRNIGRYGCYIDSASLGACMGDTLQLHPFVQAKEAFSPSSPLLVCFPLEWKNFKIHNTTSTIKLLLSLFSRMGVSTFRCCGVVVDDAQTNTTNTSNNILSKRRLN